jgi:DNA-directed RNA polymerase subunit alpha
MVEPFEQGFGTTIGNSLRRVLLSSLEGAAVTAIKIDGVSHEFTSMDGILEDVTDIVLNVKGLVLRLDGDGPIKVTVSSSTSGDVTAGDIECDPSVTVVNTDHHLATLTSDVSFHMELTVNRGRGYTTAAQNRRPEQEVGVIPVDAVFSPVVRVRYHTENMRVDDRTNYDRLVLEVWTKGTVMPEDALVEAGMILRKHLNPFVMYHELGEQIGSLPQGAVEKSAEPDSALDELLSKPVSILNLSVRASNCLEAARISTLRDLVTKTESDLLRVRSFGKTSLDEVESKLSEMNLSLGMKPDGGDPAPSGPAPSPGSPGLGPLDRPLGGGPVPGSGPMEVFTMGD